MELDEPKTNANEGSEIVWDKLDFNKQTTPNRTTNNSRIQNEVG